MSLKKNNKQNVDIGEKMAEFVQEKYKVQPNNYVMSKEEYDEYLKNYNPKNMTSVDGKLI